MRELFTGGSGGKSPSSENRPPVPKVHVTKKYSSKGDAAAGRKAIEKPKSSKVRTFVFSMPIFGYKEI